MNRAVARATAARDTSRPGTLEQRPEEAERIETARRAGRTERKLLGAVTPIRVTRKVGR